MKKMLQKSIWLLLVVALLVSMSIGISGVALAADETPAEPVITVTGQDILPGVAGMTEAPYLIACKDTNAMTAALTQDGKTIESGVTWSFGTKAWCHDRPVQRGDDGSQVDECSQQGLSGDQSDV